MKHKVGFNRLGRKPAHRKALHRNMVTSLFKHERIRTTKAKARAIRRTAEKMITRAKVDSVHNRRMIARDLKDKAILAKLFVDIGPRFKTRPGGYTRMLKIGHRAGDASEMVILELVGEEVEETRKPKKAAKTQSAKRAAEPKAPATPAPVESEAVSTDASVSAPEAEASAGDTETVDESATAADEPAESDDKKTD